jgi:hypothetical protein
MVKQFLVSFLVSYQICTKIKTNITVIEKTDCNAMKTDGQRRRGEGGK